MAGAEKNLLQFVSAENPCQFREAEEGDEQHTNENAQGKNSLPRSPTDFGDARAKGLPAIHAEDGFFEDFETSQHNREGGGFQEGRIDEWRTSNWSARRSFLATTMTLERQSIEERDTMCRKLDVIVGKDHGFVDR